MRADGANLGRLRGERTDVDQPPPLPGTPNKIKTWQRKRAGKEGRRQDR